MGSVKSGGGVGEGIVSRRRRGKWSVGVGEWDVAVCGDVELTRGGGGVFRRDGGGVC